MKEQTTAFYNKHYKTLLILPILLLLVSVFIIGHTYVTTGDVFHKDVSLTGGTTITVSTNAFSGDLLKALSAQIPDVEVNSLLDNSGKQTQLVIVTSQPPEKIQPAIEQFLGEKLTPANSSIEFTGSNLSASFYTQLLIAVIIAFFWMSAVVFVIFAHKLSIKIWVIIINILFGIFLGKIFLALPLILGIIISLIFIALLVYLYFKHSIPSFAVMSCAFADILMTLAVVDLIGMKVSGAGIVAFLMLIGYSVDTDILLTTRVLRRKGTSVNHEVLSAFKTGMTMTLTAIAAIAVSLIFIFRFQTSLNQIFTILIIGLVFDIFNTWLTNTSLIKWFAERQ
jgi:preprotein translocase subunit SecF